jgi:hypothetical protein
MVFRFNLYNYSKILRFNGSSYDLDFIQNTKDNNLNFFLYQCVFCVPSYALYIVSINLTIFLISTYYLSYSNLSNTTIDGINETVVTLPQAMFS